MATVRRRVRLAALVLLASAAWPASAQVAIDAGAHVGEGCVRGETKCTDTVRFLGPYAGVWFGDRVAVRARYLELRLDNLRDAIGDVILRREDRRRRLMLGEVSYHFLPKSPVRPFVGASIGRRWDQLTYSCEPVSCAEAGPGGPSPFTGVMRAAHVSVGMIGGLSFQPIERLTVQGLLGIHDFPGEEGGTIEGAVLVGVSLWRSQ